MNGTTKGPGGVLFPCPGCDAEVCIIGESQVLERRDEPKPRTANPLELAYKPHDCPAEVPEETHD